MYFSHFVEWNKIFLCILLMGRIEGFPGFSFFQYAFTVKRHCDGGEEAEKHSRKNQFVDTAPEGDKKTESR